MQCKDNQMVDINQRRPTLDSVQIEIQRYRDSEACVCSIQTCMLMPMVLSGDASRAEEQKGGDYVSETEIQRPSCGLCSSPRLL